MSDRKSHWEKIYADKAPPEVSWYQKQPVFSLSLMHNTQVAQAAPIIDVGGGASNTGKRRTKIYLFLLREEVA